MNDFYNKVSLACSKGFTNAYSTSFSSGINSLSKELHDPIYAIYGFVRLADEIVDTFYGFNQAELLKRCEKETYLAIEEGISLNPILHSFQEVVRAYNIPKEFVEAFLYSMELDLTKTKYTEEEYKKYIYGSAEVVGLMCLKVFCKGDDVQFETLKEDACALGSAFQKINFLRDIKSDFEDRGRVYFPHLNYNTFSEEDKKRIEDDLQLEFDKGLNGIERLPKSAQNGVRLAYQYYIRLFEKIKKCSAADLKKSRIRVSGWEKLGIFLRLKLINGSR
jgi:phytoene/squalene synthetase